jgi:hypothetical protein
MTPKGGTRPGAGRKPRQEPKTKPIWCGQMSEAERDLIIAMLAPEERGKLLLDAARTKQEGKDDNRSTI